MTRVATTSSAPKNDTRDEPQVLLIAQLRAHLVNGEALELLPVSHESDVKHEVEALVQSWSESGFLLHGRFFYPWHQVRSIEVTSVEEMPVRLAHQRLEELYGAERSRVQEAFWRTRRHTPQKEDPDRKQ
jgi:hypothetical protein